MIRFCLLMISIVFVDGHSLLRTPQAWKTSESKRAPCGGVTLANSVGKQTTVDPASAIASQWDVTAGDGNGPITVTYVTTDAEATTTGFNTANTAGQTLTVNMPNIPQRGTGQYPFTLTAPAAGICKGGADGKSCHIQVKSTSNWYSCATLAMNEPAAPTPAPIPAVTSPPTRSPLPPTPIQCVPLMGTTGTICQGLEGKQHFAVNELQELLPAITQDFQVMRYNPLVFRNPEPMLCAQYLAQLYCTINIPACSGQQTELPVCKSRCQSAMYECDIDPYHYDALLGMCDDIYFSAQATDIYGACPAVSQRIIHLKNVLIGNDPDFWAPNVKYLSKKIYVGDKLTWKWKSPSTLFKFPNEAAFKICDFNSAVPMTGATDGDYLTYSVDTSDGIAEFNYYGSNTGCVADTQMQQNGFSQKIAVEIINLPMGSTEVGFGNDAPPEEISQNPPTQSPPGFLGNPGGIDSGVEKMQITFAAIICTFLMVSL